MSPRASTTSAPSDTSAATSSLSAARNAENPPSSGPPGVPIATPGTPTPSITDEGSTPRPLPSADPADRPREGMRHRVAASLRTGFFGSGALFPASQRGPSAADIRSWPGWNGGEGPVCGAFAGNGPTGGTLSACASCATIPPFKFARSLFAYEGSVRDAILAMKYARQSVPAEALAKRLLEAVAGKWADRFPAGYRPAVVPVPIGPLRYFHRGFNLPGLIARSLARLAGWPFSPLALRRHGGNPQAGRCLAEREQN